MIAAAKFPRFRDTGRPRPDHGPAAWAGAHRHGGSVRKIAREKALPDTGEPGAPRMGG